MFINIPSFGWKNSVESAADLPLYGNTAGDVRVVLEDNSIRVWDESSSTWVLSSGGGGTGISSLNGLISSSQTFQTGASGNDFNISSAGSIHTFNIPSASSTARGLISTGTQTIAGDKTFTGTTVVGYTPAIAANWLTVPTSLSQAVNLIKAGDFSAGITLLDNTSATAFTFPDTSHYAVINYSINRNGANRVGRLLVVHDGIDISISDDFLETALTGITFSAGLSMGNVVISYTTNLTTFNATLKYNILKWV